MTELEVEGRLGAVHGERSLDLLTYRNGYRNRNSDTRVSVKARPEAEPARDAERCRAQCARMQPSMRTELPDYPHTSDQ